MARRHSTAARAKTHLWLEDPDVPGTCVHCALLRANDVHQLPATDPAAADLEARRMGERPEGEL